LDAAGNQIAQMDEVPVHNTYLTAAGRKAGETLTDV
jgi:hypothetical protein